MSITTPAVGERVRLRHDVDRYPHFIAPAGAVGTITDLGSPAGSYISVRLDEHLPGAETWNNEVVWSEIDDPGHFALDCVYADAEVEPASRHTIVVEVPRLADVHERVFEERATQALKRVGLEVVEYHYEQMTTTEDPATLAEAEQLADVSGQSVEWRGQTIYPDRRPGHTRHPEIR